MGGLVWWFGGVLLWCSVGWLLWDFLLAVVAGFGCGCGLRGVVWGMSLLGGCCRRSLLQFLFVSGWVFGLRVSLGSTGGWWLFADIADFLWFRAEVVVIA